MLTIHRASVAILLVTQLAYAQSADDDAADARRLIAALNIHKGSVVGEIGAGRGELTVAMAREAGPGGHVYSNELNADRRRDISRAVKSASLGNVTVVEGASTDARLPDQCCDALFMRNVYHHFADPATMNATLFRATKPGGTIAVIDFAPPGKEAEPPRRGSEGSHGVNPESVLRELHQAGFDEVTSEKLHDRVFIVVARRPISPQSRGVDEDASRYRHQPQRPLARTKTARVV